MAEYPHNVEELINNIEKLDQVIRNTEQALSKDITSFDKQELEKLEKLNLNLIDLKIHSSNLKKGNSIDEAITLSDLNQWPDISNVLNKIKTLCSGAEGLEKECYIEISNFFSFIKIKQLSEEYKNKVNGLVSDYSQFNESKTIINNSFIQTTSKLLTETTEIIASLHKPFAVIKMTPLILEKEISSTMSHESLKSDIRLWTSLSNFYLRFKFYIAIGLLFLVIAIAVIVRKINNKKLLKFYKKIYFVSRKNQLETKLFGKVKFSNRNKLKNIEESYYDLLVSSQMMNKDVDVRIKNKDNKLIIETQFHSEKAIEEFLNEESSEDLIKEFESIEKKLISLGGELHLSNYFDPKGKLTKTCFTVVI